MATPRPVPFIPPRGGRRPNDATCVVPYCSDCWPSAAVFKFVMACISITLPIPCGLFTPVFCAGAAMGRIYGEGVPLWRALI